MTRAKKAKATGADKPVDLTEKDQARLEELKPRFARLPKRARSTVEYEGNKAQIERAPDQNLDLYYYEMFTAVGSRSADFLNEFLNGVQRATSGGAGKPSAQEYNAMIAVLSAVEPRNEVEALLAGQIIAANNGAVRCMRAMQDADFLPQFQAYGNLANKFMRTEAALVESLAKLRRGGEQIVKHVHVHEGGKAVVADTLNQQVNHHHQGGGASAKTAEQAYGAAAIEGCAALSRQDAPLDLLSVSRDAERAMSPARGQKSGGAEG